MKKILSISIAAYNVEKYIEETLDSILSSKYKNDIEILITNDGSKDKTGDIIKKYSDEYSKIIKYINQENSGAGSTVNNGIKHATGKYFKMVDGDDWVITENLDKLIEYLKTTDCDAVITNFEYYYEKTKSKKIGSTYNLEAEKVYNFNEVCDKIDVATSTVTYKTSILKGNKIVVSPRYYSDYQFQVYPIPFINTISYLDISIYIYRIGREGQSVSIKGYQSHIDDHQKVMYQLVNYYEKYKDICDTKVKTFILNKITSFINVDVSVLMSFGINKNTKKRVETSLENIKESSIEVYDYISCRRITGKLIKSGFKNYYILSTLKHIKLKLKI